MNYILNEQGQPQVEEDAMKWARWFHENMDKRILQQDTRLFRSEEVLISTVFLGMDHNLSGPGEPILYETMVFGPDDLLSYMQENAEENILSIFGTVCHFNDIQRRYTTREKALSGHRAMLAYVEVCSAKIERGNVKEVNA